MHDFVCEYCGKPFSDVKKVRQFCSKHCARMAQRERRENGKGNKRISRVRPFTPDTAYLITKWHKEGMNEQCIAEMLNRPLEVIIDVLNGNGGNYEVIVFSEYNDGKRRYRKHKIEEEPVKKPRKERSGRAVRCVETGEVFPSRKAAAKFANVNSSAISHCCLGQTMVAGGYHWVNA